MKRESFKSRLGFLLIAAGCAIGIGNVWRFPYIAGNYGGGVFVLFYLIFLVILAVPVLTMELAIGRASRKSTVALITNWKNRVRNGTFTAVSRWQAITCSDVLYDSSGMDAQLHGEIHKK